MVLGMGLFILGINLVIILSLGSCPILRLTLRVGPVLTSRSNSALASRSGSMPASWSCSMLAFHSDYGPVAFPLNSLSSLSRLLCRAAVVSTTFQQATCRAASYFCRGADSLSFPGESPASAGDVHLCSLSWREERISWIALLLFHFSTRGEPWCSI